MEFEGHVQVRLDRKSSLVTVVVEDRVPERARDIANTLAEEANHIDNTLEMRRSGQERVFLEARLQEVRRDLARSRWPSRSSRPSTACSTWRADPRDVRTIANLRAELMTRRIQLSYDSSFAGGEEQNATRCARDGRNPAAARQVREGGPDHPDEHRWATDHRPRGRHPRARARVRPPAARPTRSRRRSSSCSRSSTRSPRWARPATPAPRRSSTRRCCRRGARGPGAAPSCSSARC